MSRRIRGFSSITIAACGVVNASATKFEHMLSKVIRCDRNLSFPKKLVLASICSLSLQRLNAIKLRSTFYFSRYRVC